MVTSSVRVRGASKPVVSVRTASAIPKDKIADAIGLMKDLTVDAPVNAGDVVIADIAGTGVDLIATYTIR